MAMTPVVEPANAGIETLTSPQRFADAALIRRWHELLSASPNLDRTFQSPEWFEHARANPGARPLDAAVIVRRGRGGAVDAIVPLVKDYDALAFVAGPRTLHTFKLKSAMVLGSQFMGAEDEASYDELLGAVDQWASDWWLADWECLKAFYTTGATLDQNEVGNHVRANSTPPLKPLAIPPFEPKCYVSRWAFAFEKKS